MASRKHVTTYVFCPVKQKMVEKGTEQRVDASGAPMVIPPLEPFKSPITGEVISSREQLRRHHREHGTTDARDYSPEFMQKRAEERQLRASGAHPDDKADRIRRLKNAVYGNRR